MRASGLQVIDLIDGLIVRHIWIPVLFLSFPLIYSLPDGRQPRRRRVPQRPNGREFTCQCTYLPPTSGTIVFWLRHRSPCPDPDFPQKVSGRTSYEPTSASPHCLVICDGCHTEMKFDERCSVSGESTSHSRCIRFSWNTMMLAHTQSRNRLARPIPFAAQHATAAQNQPPTRRMFPCDRTLSTHGDIAYDCSWTVSRNALQTHTSHCPYTALKGFFRIPDARAAVLKTESVRLRAMLDC